MSNQTLYPFGPGGQIPSGLDIVDNLETGGRTKALSAEQGKVLRNRIRAMSEAQYQQLSSDDKSLVVAIISDEAVQPGIVGDYIESGIILQLSGISGVYPTQWVATVGNNPFSIIGTVSEEENGFSFSGGGGMRGDIIDAPQQSSTLEVAFEITSFGSSWNTLFSTNCKTQTSSICAAIKSDSLIWTTSNEKMYSGTISTGKHTLSVNADLALLDGVELTRSNNENYIGFSSSTYSGLAAIIAANDSRYYSLAGGTIYAVRVYNRKLSKAEMLSNQIEDNEEYSLGLTISE